MNYCSECGHKLSETLRPGKNLPRYHCSACDHHFQHHPKLLVASFITCGDKLLWMRRALEPKKGYWAIPAGFMEQGETLQQAGARELYEETGVQVSPQALQLYMVGTIEFISQVYVAFHAEVESEYCDAGKEALEVKFFSRDKLPWENVAYPEANNSINRAYDDIARRRYGLYHAQMTHSENSLIEITHDGCINPT
jgi:ADP-ribose pyrophosphatase YjhB (NUDIX family)